MSNNILRASLGFKGEQGFSPTIGVSKTGGVVTLTITDVNGTRYTTISDGEITKAMVVDDLTSTTTDVPLSANQGRVLKGLIDGLPSFYNGNTEPDADLGANGDVYFKYEE